MFFKSNSLFLVLTFQIYQYPKSGSTWGKTEHDNLWSLITINLKNKSFHNSVEWWGLFNFKWISHHGWEKYSDLQCSDYWKMHLWYSSHVEQSLHKFAQCLSPIKNFFWKKVPPYFRGDTMSIIINLLGIFQRLTWEWPVKKLSNLGGDRCKIFKMWGGEPCWGWRRTRKVIITASYSKTVRKETHRRCSIKKMF